MNENIILDAEQKQDYDAKKVREKLQKQDARNSLWGVLKTWTPWMIVAGLSSFMVASCIKENDINIKPITDIADVIKPPAVLQPKSDIETAEELMRQLEVPPMEQEVFIVEENSTRQEREIVLNHADMRTLQRRIIELESQVTAMVKTLNSGVALHDGMTPERVTDLARNQVAYYWKNHDAQAKKRGWKNVIRWVDVNY